MPTIATYWWQPDPGSKFVHPYGADDVRRLQRDVAANMTIPHEFVVITDRPELFADDTSIRAVQIDWTKHVSGHCWVRFMTFHPEGRKWFGDYILQLDLDMLIVGNIDAIASRTEDLVLWRNPARVPWNGHLGRHGQGRGQGRSIYNCSILMHRTGSMPEVWRNFDPQNPQYRDDQWLLSDVMGPDMPYYDGERDGVYRIARPGEPWTGIWGEMPENARIVTYPGSHGKPDNPVVREANPWLEELAWA